MWCMVLCDIVQPVTAYVTLQCIVSRTVCSMHVCMSGCVGVWVSVVYMSSRECYVVSHCYGQVWPMASILCRWCPYKHTET